MNNCYDLMVHFHLVLHLSLRSIHSSPSRPVQKGIGVRVPPGLFEGARDAIGSGADGGRRGLGRAGQDERSIPDQRWDRRRTVLRGRSEARRAADKRQRRTTLEGERRGAVLVRVGRLGLPAPERVRRPRHRQQGLARCGCHVRQLAVLGAAEVPDRDLVRQREELRDRRDQRHRDGE